METTHQYLEKYPISQASEKIIIGTIHPHNIEDFIVPFFYGHKLSIWNILNLAFPDEVGNPITLESILAFLKKNKIAVSDTVMKCKRKSSSALDEDFEPITLNYGLIDQIKKSNITEIYFTSGFQKNNAFKLFYKDILGLRITQELRANRSTILDTSFFGREVKLTILYSPSGAANVGLSKSKIYKANMFRYMHSKTPVLDFKIDHYKSAFSSKADP